MMSFWEQTVVVKSENWAGWSFKTYCTWWFHLLLCLIGLGYWPWHKWREENTCKCIILNRTNWHQLTSELFPQSVQVWESQRLPRTEQGTNGCDRKVSDVAEMNWVWSKRWTWWNRENAGGESKYEGKCAIASGKFTGNKSLSISQIVQAIQGTPQKKSTQFIAALGLNVKLTEKLQKSKRTGERDRQISLKSFRAGVIQWKWREWESAHGWGGGQIHTLPLKLTEKIILC